MENKDAEQQMFWAYRYQFTVFLTCSLIYVTGEEKYYIYTKGTYKVGRKGIWNFLTTS